MASLSHAGPSKPLVSRGRRFLALQDEVQHSSQLIDLDVLTTIDQHTVAGLHLVPRRGLENAGVLYGYVERGREGQRVVVIDDSRPIESEHMFGPDFRLSEADWEAFKHPEGRTVVGVYRSHTRTDPPPTEDDGRLWSASSVLQDGLLLVVTPSLRSASTAVAFSRDTAGFRRFAEFPMRAAALEREGYVIVAEPGAKAGEVKPIVLAPAKRGRRPTPLLWWTAALAVFLAAASLLLYRPAPDAGQSRTRTSEPVAVMTPTPPEPAAAAPAAPSTARPKRERQPPVRRAPERVVSAARVTLESVPQNAFRRFWSSIPGARKLQRDFRGAENYQPPRAGRQPSPQFPLRMASELADLSPIVVRLNINERGRVEKAKVLSHGVRSEIREAAVAGLRGWQFRPARAGARAVSSRVNVILHF